MKTQKLILLLTSLLLTAQILKSQTAPNFTLTDIDGNTHTLYDYLDQGKYVVLDFSTTWCGPCWDVHQGHSLKNAYLEKGPNGTDEMRVLYIECDIYNYPEQLTGSQDGGYTYGDWVTGTPYPIIDLAIEDQSVIDEYGIFGYPTIYLVCPDRSFEDIYQFYYTDITKDDVFFEGDKCPEVSTNMSSVLGQETNDLNLKLYPNPSDKVTSLSFKLDKEESLNMERANVVGEILESQNDIRYNKGENIIDMNTSEMKPGTYFIRLSGGQYNEVVKLVVE